MLGIEERLPKDSKDMMLATSESLAETERYSFSERRSETIDILSVGRGYRIGLGTGLEIPAVIVSSSVSVVYERVGRAGRLKSEDRHMSYPVSVVEMGVLRMCVERLLPENEEL